MIVRPSFPIVAFVLSSCAPQNTNAVQTPELRESAGVVHGTVAYKERVALPADAVVDVWITDVSPLIVVMSVIAETTVPSNGRQVPLPFELRYDPTRIVADHIYSVKAAIRSAGEILFASETDTLVITKENPTQVNLWLVRPGG